MRNATIAILATTVLAGCVAQISAPVEDSKNRVVDIVNTTGSDADFYAINAERKGLFRDRFSPLTLARNDYTTINFIDGSGVCLFDLYASFPDGKTALAPGFDTCAKIVWVITPEMPQ